MSNKYLLLLTLILLLISGCNNKQNENFHATQAATLSGKLVITGSSTIAPLATELAKQFESQHPNTKIDVQTGGSARGISDVRRGISHVGMVSRKLKVTEHDLQGHLLALDGVSIIVHKNNPITEINEQQIRDIYLGKIHNWQSLTENELPITVINKAEGRSTLEVFLEYFALKNPQIKADAIIGDNEQAIKLVANNPTAIAYVSIGTAEYDIAHGSNIKLLPLNGAVANSTNIINKSFPLSRELNFVTQNNENLLVTAFLQFATAVTAQPIIEKFGFVPAKTR